MEVHEWLDTKLGQDIWEKKYRFNNESFDEWLDRVSGGNEDVKRLILEKKFLFGGRILANRGLQHYGRKISYSNCFVEGSKVITKRGLINIEDVQVGDYVITHDGTWQRVNAVMVRDYEGDLYQFESHSIYDKIVCTPNHKLLTQNGWKRADCILACSKQVNNPDRLKVADFRFEKKYDKIDFTEHFKPDNKTSICYMGDKVQIQSHYTIKGKTCTRLEGHPVNRYAELDEDFRYFIGRWLGDGSVTCRRGKSNPSIVQIVFNKEKEEKEALRIAAIGEKVFGIAPSIRYTNQNIIAVRFENEIIGSWFLGEFGQRCDGKKISDKYLGDLIIALGLLDADSCISTHGRLKIVLKNYNLIKWLRDTLYLNGINTSEIKKVERQQNTYQLEISSYIVKGRLSKLLNKTYYDKRMGLTEIRSLFKDYVEITNISIIENAKCKVYNLSVENNHSYTVNGVIVHNCYVVTPPEDNLESIFDCAKKLARTYSYGGGCGIDLSKLAPRGAKINNAAKQTTGSVSFMDLYNLVTDLIGMQGRRGALMLSLICNHPDLEEFIKVKSNLNKVTKANISIRILDEFIKAVIEDKPWKLSFTRKETGEVIEKTVSAREIFREIAEMNWDNGEPGMLFWDRICRWNLLSEDKNFEYASVNPCA